MLTHLITESFKLYGTNLFEEFREQTINQLQLLTRFSLEIFWNAHSIKMCV